MAINTVILSGKIFSVNATEKGTSANISVRKGKDEQGNALYTSHRIFIPASVLNGRTVEEKESLTIEGRIVPGSYKKDDGTTVYTNTVFVNHFEKSAKGIAIAIIEGNLFIKGETEREGRNGKYTTSYGNLSVYLGKNQDGGAKYAGIDVSLSGGATRTIKNLNIQDGSPVVLQGKLNAYKTKDGAYKENFDVEAVHPVFIDKPAEKTDEKKAEEKSEDGFMPLPDDGVPFDEGSEDAILDFLKGM